jgi:hypothetical protein
MAESAGYVTTLPASTIAHLYGDRFAGPLGPGEIGTTCYSTGRGVVTRTLAGTMVACALWDLRERGAIALDPYHEKKLFGTKSGVRARLIAEIPAAGVDAALMKSLTRQKKAREPGIDVRSLVNSTVPTSPNPHNEVIGLALIQELDEGYLTKAMVDGPVDRHGKTGKPRARYVPESERVAGLAARADSLLVAWDAFGANESELKDLLMKESFGGISLSTRTESDGADD